MRDGMTNMKMRVWWVPQIPMKSFNVEVFSVAEGVKLMDILADYDIFQFENNIKSDFCNAGGIQVFNEKDKEDGPDGSWVDWWDEATGEDNPRQYMENLANN